MHIYIYLEMVLINLFAGKEWRLRYREWAWDMVAEGDWGTIGESSTVIYTLSWVREIAAKKLLYNAGSPAWCSLMTWRGGVEGRGGRLKTEVVYIYVLSRFSCVWLFVALQTVARQAPLSMEFSRQDTGVGCHALLQGIFLTKELNLSLIMCPALAGWFFTTSATWEAHYMCNYGRFVLLYDGNQHSIVKQFSSN